MRAFIVVVEVKLGGLGPSLRWGDACLPAYETRAPIRPCGGNAPARYNPLFFTRSKEK